MIQLDDKTLIKRADEWLAPLLVGKRRLGDIASAGLTSALEATSWLRGIRRLDQFAPAEFISPAASRHAIDYSAPAGPTVEVRAQALFGLSSHPTIANGQVPLNLAITSPAGRPIQTTGSARLLEGQLARGRQGDAWALPQASLA